MQNLNRALQIDVLRPENVIYFFFCLFNIGLHISFSSFSLNRCPFVSNCGRAGFCEYLSALVTQHIVLNPLNIDNLRQSHHK